MRFASLVPFLVILSIATVACWAFLGHEAVGEGFANALELLLTILPQLILGLTIAGLVHALIDREKVSKVLGRESGFKGILIGCGLGAIMPGGPFAAFPVVHVMARSGVDNGPLIAFLVAWATIGVNRLIIWEIPFMGLDFGLIRFFASLPIPVIAGLLATTLSRRFPILSVVRER